MNLNDYREKRLPVMSIIDQRLQLTLEADGASILVSLPDHWTRDGLIQSLKKVFDPVAVVTDGEETSLHDYDYILDYDGSILEKVSEPLKAKGIILCTLDGKKVLSSKRSLLQTDVKTAILEEQILYRLFSTGYSAAQAFIDYYQNKAGMLLAGKKVIMTGLDDTSLSMANFFFAFNAQPCFLLGNSLEKLQCSLMGWQLAEKTKIENADFLFLGRNICQDHLTDILKQIGSECFVVNIGGIEMEKRLRSYTSSLTFDCEKIFRAFHYHGTIGERILLFDGLDAIRESFSCYPSESTDMLYSLSLLCLEEMCKGKEILTESMSEQIASIKLQTFSSRG